MREKVTQSSALVLVPSCIITHGIIHHFFSHLLDGVQVDNLLPEQPGISCQHPELVETSLPLRVRRVPPQHRPLRHHGPSFICISSSLESSELESSVSDEEVYSELLV